MLQLLNMLSLKEVVQRYSALAAKPGEPVALSSFHLSAEETVRLFTALDEDYHISRFLHFSLSAADPSYVIGGEHVSHLAIDPAISSQL